LLGCLARMRAFRADEHKNLMSLDISSEAIARLRARPGFVEAMRADACATLALVRGNPLINMLMNDRARTLFVMGALYLHYDGTAEGRPGLTVGAMKDLCVSVGVCSRGRCEAMLAVLRAGRYFVSAPDGDRRRRRLVPTPKLVALQIERWRCHLTAITEVLPETQPHVAALDDPAFVRAFARVLGDGFVCGFRVLTHAPDLASIAERNAGILIFYALAVEGDEAGPFPPVAPVPLSISRLATQFAVSRKHVLTLLRDAEAAGLLLRGPEPDRVTLLAPARDGLERFVAAFFLYFTGCARQALATCRADAEESSCRADQNSPASPTRAPWLLPPS
jgi:hypothetical protein